MTPDDGRDGPRPAGERPSDDEVWAGLVESFNSPDEPVGRWPASEDVEDEPEAGPDSVAYEEGTSTGDDAADAGPREGRVLRPVLGAPFGVPAAPAPPVPPAQGAEEGEHFVPPPPPPIPRGDAVSRAAWAGALGGPGLLMVAALAGLGLPSWLVGLCVVGFVAGFATLIVRLRGHDPYDPDDGAVV